MDMFVVLLVIALIGGGFLAYLVFFKKPKGYQVLIDFSELVGNEIIEHGQLYKGFADEQNDLMTCNDLNLKRPIPPRNVIKNTNKGTKKLFLLKLDNDRYAYRIPSLKNQMYTYKRDLNGNFVMDELNKKILVKHQWTLCDDVVEQDVKHWEDHMQEINRKNHETKMDALQRWAGPVSMVLIFLFAVVALNMSTKSLSNDKAMIMERSEQMQKDARETQQSLNNLLEKVSGQRVLSNEDQDREDYQNANP